jgi:hypothetical protein
VASICYHINCTALAQTGFQASNFLGHSSALLAQVSLRSLAQYVLAAQSIRPEVGKTLLQLLDGAKV